ncbi:MAG TPA: GNAT family N-acetyltransferase [Rhodothermales bacterium]|nr:GNAT family N-acetyltransferase [Rhodothermales bacterium]
MQHTSRTDDPALSWELLSRVQTPGERDVFEAMYDLYEASFPEDSERESKEKWERVLRAAEQQTYVLEFMVARMGSEVVGGAAYEYYPMSECGLLTFLFVRSAYRGRGIARGLVARVHRRLTSEKPLRILFAEVEDPVLVEANGIETSIDPHLRLRILAQLGAKAVDIHYVQPALEPHKKPAEHLMLLAMVHETMNTIDRRTLEAFLNEFYASLGVETDAASVLLEHAFANTTGERVSLAPLV